VKFHDLHNWHRGSDCVVVASGPSADPGVYTTPEDQEECYVFPMAADYAERWTLGTNRAATFCHPDYAIAIDPYDDPVWAEMQPYTAPVYFTGRDPATCPAPRAIQIGNFAEAEELQLRRDGHMLLHVPVQSIAQCPFFALSVAAYLGFETIGVIGVDLSEDRWPDVTRINETYALMVETCKKQGSRVINLSPESRCTGIPAGKWEEVRGK